MERKTNLFYFEGNESNFLTFSNYTEHMTGNFLATDYKLFPSRFLCLNIPSLNNVENKKLFIKNYLCGYYENKLAFLRDKLLESSMVCDLSLLYLNYLLDAIYKYENDNNIEESEKCDFNNIFISDITEQNYNGTFTDIICTIEHFSNTTFSISKVSHDSLNIFEYNKNTNYLYGWTDNDVFIGPNNYLDIKPIFDNVSINEEETFYEYYLNSSFDTKFIKNTTTISELNFNIIIPLYDCVNVNYKYNSTIIDELDEIDLQLDTYDTARNVPLGIWFSNENILLKRDTLTGYSPSWSLLIGTQFKPFPNSNVLNTDRYDTSKSESYATFAEVLNKQSKVLDLFETYDIVINELKNKINQLENKLSKLCDLDEISKLQSEMETLIDKFNINNETYVNKWQYVINNSNIRNK